MRSPSTSRPSRTLLAALALLAAGASAHAFPPAASASRMPWAAYRSVATTTSWEGRSIPRNPVTGAVGVGSVCVEMHLSTSPSSPFAAGAYREVPGLATVTGGGGTRDYSSRNYMTPARKDGTWPGGAFGHMTPEQEQWYCNMRWGYAAWNHSPGGTRATGVDWKSLAWHRDHPKLLVTNEVTGLSAVAWMGDSGPGLGLGRPSGNRIGGVSPDLMYYLSGRSGGSTSTTAFGADDTTPYRFEWVTDQSLPLGPVGKQKPRTVVSPGTAGRAVRVAAPTGRAAARVFVGMAPVTLPGVPLAGLGGTAPVVAGNSAVVASARAVPSSTPTGVPSGKALPFGTSCRVLSRQGPSFLVELPGRGRAWLRASDVVLAYR